jgi:hypothetical protein
MLCHFSHRVDTRYRIHPISGMLRATRVRRHALDGAGWSLLFSFLTDSINDVDPFPLLVDFGLFCCAGTYYYYYYEYCITL